VGFFGWVFYCQPWFEVRIDKKINSWSGSIEVGVTCCDPSTIDVPFPSSATELREGTWIMSGNSILKAGCPAHNLTQMFYDQDKALRTYQCFGVDPDPRIHASD
jgi:hypothetical protein